VTLLDDPVQHLDNIDAVALLDGLREFARITGKQIIISTCDYYLYKLMIQKFAKKWRGSAKTLIAMRLEDDATSGIRVRYDVHANS
jgi:ABC-type lipoprotein export system ATPase subunit